MLKPIGEGSTSIVYESENPLQVIKQFKTTFSEQSRSKEIKILQTVQGESVVRLLEYNAEHLVLERLQSKDLFDLVKNGGLDIQMSKELSKQLITIIQRVHNKGIVHRDIKLENILLGKADAPILCDFGFSEFISESNVKRHVGTQMYMAPEIQFESMLGTPNSETISTSVLIKSDIFSLGVCMFILLIGFPPFQSTRRCTKCYYWRLISLKKWDAYWQLIQKQTQQVLNNELKDFLQQCLHSDPFQRASLEDLSGHILLQ